MPLFNPSRGLCLKKLCLSRHYASVTTEGNVSKAVYPPILDLKVKAKHQREKDTMYEKIQALNTVEEKLFSLNVPKYYGWETLILNEGKVPYNFLPLVKYVTKTRLHKVDNPAEIALSEEKVKEIVERIKGQMEKVIVFHAKSQRLSHELQPELHKNLKESEAKKMKADNLVEQINRIILANLSREFPHLLSAQVDYKPRIEAFWNVGGFGLTEAEREKRKKKKVDEDILEEPAAHWIQYFGRPILHLRSNLPLALLKEAVPTETWEYEEFPYDPALTYALETKRMYGACVPGFWPDDPHKFGLLSVHSLPHCSADDFDCSVHASAILSSFAWLLGQACYQGFTTFNELTYPLTTQTVLTNGQQVSLYSYQMNSCVTVQDNGKRNECYTSGPMELYASIENGQIKGWNEVALSQLLSFYTNPPAERKGVNLTPYLNPNESLIQHIEFEKRRVWLFNIYRHFVSHRGRSKLPPEIYDWEYIYKVAFNARPMDARKRFFEQDLDPLEDRRMGEKTKQDRVYIPKALRPEDQKYKKFDDTYYPDV